MEKLQVFVTAGPGYTKIISINNDTKISKILELSEKKMKIPQKFFWLTYCGKPFYYNDKDLSLIQFNQQYGLNLGNNSTIRCNIRAGNRISINTGP